MCFANFSITSYLISLFLSLQNKNTRCKKKYKTRDNNQTNYKSKSCRAAEFSKFCKFPMERKTGLASIAGCCFGGPLTGVLGSENPSSSSIVIGLSTDPSSS